MQEHVQLEVSLEIIMAEIAQVIFKLGKTEDEKAQQVQAKLNDLIKLQEEAFKYNREAILKILNREF